MNNICQKLIAGITVLSLMYINSITVFASENAGETQYVENHVDINLTNINLAVSNGEDLIMSVDKSKNYFQQINGENNIEKIEEIIEDYPEFEQDLIDSVESYNDVAAIGCTEAPLEMVNGQLERIEEEQSNVFNINANATERKHSDNGNSYYINLSTWVNRFEYNKKTKKYHYMCESKAYWQKNSMLGGKKYPASGDDYLLQSVPNNFAIDYDLCTTLYNNGKTDPTGSYRRVKGSSKYVQYAITDDPIGPSQLKEASVITSSYAKLDKGTKRVNSYYIHTWKSLSVKVSVSASRSSREGSQVKLQIVPSIKNKSWQIYNYVSFNF